MKIIATLMALLMIPAAVFAGNEASHLLGPLDLIKYKGSDFTMTGSIVEETDEYVVIMPKNGGRVTVHRDLIDEIVYDSEEPRPVSTDELVEGFTAQLRDMIENAEGFHVVEVSGHSVLVNVGRGKVDRKGWEASVYRAGKQIIDPVTGEALGAEEAPVGVIQIIGVEEKYSTALPVNAPASKFQAGDKVSFLGESPTLAIADITTLTGAASPYGTLLSENLTSELGKIKDLEILERKEMNQVLRELAEQNAMIGDVPDGETLSETERRLSTDLPSDTKTSAILDKNMVKKMSALQGADALLLGTVTDSKGDASVNLRIVDTSTGAILYSLHTMVTSPEKPVKVSVAKATTKKEPEKDAPVDSLLDSSTQDNAEDDSQDVQDTQDAKDAKDAGKAKDTQDIEGTLINLLNSIYKR